MTGWMVKGMREGEKMNSAHAGKGTQSQGQSQGGTDLNKPVVGVGGVGRGGDPDTGQYPHNNGLPVQATTLFTRYRFNETTASSEWAS